MALTPFQQAYADARRKWEKGGASTFDFGGKKYSVDTKEEAARQKEMKTSPMRGRGMGRADTSEAPEPPKRAEIPTGGAAKAPPSTGDSGMSETSRNVLNTLGAMGGVAGSMRAAGMASKAARAEKAAEAPRRVEPTMGRMASEARAARTDGRIEPVMGREPRDLVVEANRRAAKEAAEESARRKPEFRSRTAERMDEREMGYKRGGAVKPRGSGCARKGFGKGTMR